MNAMPPRDTRAPDATTLPLRRLAAQSAARYRQHGRGACYFALGKLRADPLFATLLVRGLVADGAHVLDLGCGQGLLAAWLDAALDCQCAGDWPAGWPPAARIGSYRGIERNPREVQRAPRIAGFTARLEADDIRSATLESAGHGQADLIVLLDVLHYLEARAQEQLLRRVHAALAPAGQLLLRVGDAAGGLRFHLSRWVDAAVLAARGYPRGLISTRTLEDWRALLAGCGFDCEPVPPCASASFANVLLRASARRQRPA